MPLAVAADNVGVAAQIERPSPIAADSTPKRFPTRSVAIEVAVLELETGPFGCFCNEADLDLAGVALVGLELPLRAYVPTEDDTSGWLIGEDAGPSALAS